jgi:hypothetical protein
MEAEGRPSEGDVGSSNQKSTRCHVRIAVYLSLLLQHNADEGHAEPTAYHTALAHVQPSELVLQLVHQLG